MRDIGKNIRDIRISQNLTQEDLSERIHVTRQTLSNYEIGRTRPDISMLLVIAEQLNTDLDTIIYGVPDAAIRRKEKARLVVSVITTALLVTVYSFLAQKTEPHYSYELYFFNIAIVRPLAGLFLGFCISGVFSCFGKMKRQIPMRKRLVNVLIFVTVTLYLIAVSPYYINCSFAIPLVWQKAVFRVLGLSGMLSFVNSTTIACLIGVMYPFVNLSSQPV